MKKYISIVLLIIVLSFSSLALADETSTDTTEVEVNQKDQEKLNNIKKSNNGIDSLINSGNKDIDSKEDKGLDESIIEIDNKIQSTFTTLQYIFKKYAMHLAVAVSLLSVFMFILFKIAKNKMAQKGAMIMIFMPIVVYIVYSYITPFLTSIS